MNKYTLILGVCEVNASTKLLVPYDCNLVRKGTGQLEKSNRKSDVVTPVNKQDIQEMLFLLS